jgi:hypothetical protein
MWSAGILINCIVQCHLLGSSFEVAQPHSGLWRRYTCFLYVSQTFSRALGRCYFSTPVSFIARNNSRLLLLPITIKQLLSRRLLINLCTVTSGPLDVRANVWMVRTFPTRWQGSCLTVQCCVLPVDCICGASGENSGSLIPSSVVKFRTYVCTTWRSIVWIIWKNGADLLS